MMRIKNRLKSSDGLTLVELLATLVLLTIIGAITYSVLFNGINTYKRVMEETKLRDEADYIMANFIDEFYVMKASEIDEELTKIPDSNNNYYLYVKNLGKTGFYDGKVYIDNKELSFLHTDTILTSESKIEEMNGSSVDYKITLVLQSNKTKQKLVLESSVSIINDKGEKGGNNGATTK